MAPQYVTDNISILDLRTNRRNFLIPVRKQPRSSAVYRAFLKLAVYPPTASFFATDKFTTFFNTPASPTFSRASFRIPAAAIVSSSAR